MLAGWLEHTYILQLAHIARNALPLACVSCVGAAHSTGQPASEPATQQPHGHSVRCLSGREPFYYIRQTHTQSYADAPLPGRSAARVMLMLRSVGEGELVACRE